MASIALAVKPRLLTSQSYQVPVPRLRTPRISPVPLWPHCCCKPSSRLNHFSSASFLFVPLAPYLRPHGAVLSPGRLSLASQTRATPAHPPHVCSLVYHPIAGTCRCSTNFCQRNDWGWLHWLVLIPGRPPAGSPSTKTQSTGHPPSCLGWESEGQGKEREPIV